MRRDHDLVELEQRARVRLGGEDVERGAGELARADRLDQRVLVDERAARGVDRSARRRASTRSPPRPMIPAVSSVSGRWSVTKSAAPSTLLERLGSRSMPSLAEPVARRRTGRRRPRACPARGPAERPAGRSGRSRGRRASCRRARSRPSASAPSVPRFSAAWACGMLRARATSRPIVCSAAETTVDSGAFATTMPRRVAASTSTLSTPTPARPITFSRSARAITSAVSFVAERITIAS